MKAKLVVVPPKTVDDFGDVVRLRDAFAPTERLYQQLRTELSSLTSTGDPESEYVLKGERFTLRISPCSLERKVDVEKAKRKLGVSAFLECCTVTLRALGQYLAAPDVEALTITTRTGSRSYVPVPIAASTDA
jgi:hypothetical protein